MSDRVPCAVEETEVRYGINTPGSGHGPGVAATCSRCSHRVESAGTSDRSVRRCLALMREQCPNGETNYYVADD